jgi:hypothetical protein
MDANDADQFWLFVFVCVLSCVCIFRNVANSYRFGYRKGEWQLGRVEVLLKPSLSKMRHSPSRRFISNS